MARYTVIEYSPSYPNGLRIPYTEQRHAVQAADRAVKDGVAHWANVTRRDRLGRLSYVHHVERPRATA